MHHIDDQSDIPLQSSDPLQKALSNQWLSAANSYKYRDAFTNLHLERALAPQFGFDVDENVMAGAGAKTSDHLVHIEHAVGARGLGGHSPRLGDILVGSVLILLREIDEGRRLLAHQQRQAPG